MQQTHPSCRHNGTQNTGCLEGFRADFAAKNLYTGSNEALKAMVKVSASENAQNRRTDGTLPPAQCWQPGGPFFRGHFRPKKNQTARREECNTMPTVRRGVRRPF